MGQLIFIPSIVLPFVNLSNVTNPRLLHLEHASAQAQDFPAPDLRVRVLSLGSLSVVGNTKGLRHDHEWFSYDREEVGASLIFLLQ